MGQALPNGSEGGNDGKNDGGYISTFIRGPLRVGDELIYYYASSSYGKNHPRPLRLSGGGIFRARLRVDGFVSVDGGTVVTRPIFTGGTNLFLNHRGKVNVQLLDLEDGVLAQAETSGDSIQHRVDFNGASVAGSAQSKVIKLKFIVPDGSELYSFRFL